MESAETSYRRIQAWVAARKIPMPQNPNRKAGREIKRSGFVFTGDGALSAVAKMGIQANSWQVRGSAVGLRLEPAATFLLLVAQEAPPFWVRLPVTCSFGSACAHSSPSPTAFCLPPCKFPARSAASRAYPAHTRAAFRNYQRAARSWFGRTIPYCRANPGTFCRPTLG